MSDARALSAAKTESDVLRRLRAELSEAEFGQRMRLDLGKYIHSTNALDLLVKHKTHLWEYGVLLRMNDEAWFMDGLDFLITNFNRAKTADPQGTLEAIAGRFSDIHHAIERGSEAFHLEDLSQKSRNLFVRAAFRQIGDVLEGVLLPYVRQVHAILLRLPGCPLKQSSNSSSFGSLVSDLLAFPELQRVYREATSGLPIHQWRNVAQHSKYRYDGTLGKVVCRVGSGVNETDVFLSFEEFVCGLNAIGRMCDLHKIAMGFFAADNLERLASRVKVDPLSDHTVASSIMTACQTEGFEVVSLRTEEIPWKLNLNVPNGKTRSDCERLLGTVATYTSMRADLSLAFELRGAVGAKPLKGIIKKA